MKTNKIKIYITLCQLKWKSLRWNCGNRGNCRNEFIWSAKMYIDVKFFTPSSRALQLIGKDHVKNELQLAYIERKEISPMVVIL